MKTLISRAVLISMFVCGAAVADTETVAVQRFADSTDTMGRSHLTRTANMILVTVEVAELVPGDAATLWWVVFNNPGACVEGCGEDDFARRQ